MARGLPWLMARPPGSATAREPRGDGLGQAMSDLCPSHALPCSSQEGCPHPAHHLRQAGLKGLVLKCQG